MTLLQLLLNVSEEPRRDFCFLFLTIVGEVEAVSRVRGAGQRREGGRERWREAGGEGGRVSGGERGEDA